MLIHYFDRLDRIAPNSYVSLFRSRRGDVVLVSSPGSSTSMAYRAADSFATSTGLEPIAQPRLFPDFAKFVAEEIACILPMCQESDAEAVIPASDVADVGTDAVA